MSDVNEFSSNIAALAKTVFNTSVAYVRFGHESEDNLSAADKSALAISRDFCAHLESIDPDTDCIVIQDSVYDIRYRDLPSVVNPPYIRFFAEYRITSDTAGVCALYVADCHARTSFTLREKDILKALTQLAVEEVERNLLENTNGTHQQATA